MNSDKKAALFRVLLLLFFAAAALQFENVSKLDEAEANVAELMESYGRLENDIALTKERVAELDMELKNAAQELERKGRLLSEAEKTIAALNQSLQVKRQWIYTFGVVDERGVAIPLYIEMKSGDGGLLIDMRGVLLDASVQTSLKTAFYVAGRVAGADLSKKNYVFRIINPLDEMIVLSGESAGAAATVGLIALVTGKEINHEVVITGVIERDGTIGNVSQIEPKAKAAKNVNATILLVPKGRAVKVEGIEILEVSDITEVVEYILD